MAMVNKSITVFWDPGGGGRGDFKVPFFLQLSGPTDSMEGEADFFDLFSSWTQATPEFILQILTLLWEINFPRYWTDSANRAETSFNHLGPRMESPEFSYKNPQTTFFFTVILIFKFPANQNKSAVTLEFLLR